MNNLLNKHGLTLVEIIVTLAILGIVICPLMTMFVSAQIISNKSNTEYKSFLLAQKYMEEIKAMDEINPESYSYNYDSGYYERKIIQSDNNYKIKIIIVPEVDRLYKIQISIMDYDNIINELESSKIFN